MESAWLLPSRSTWRHSSRRARSFACWRTGARRLRATFSIIPAAGSNRLRSRRSSRHYDFERAGPKRAIHPGEALASWRRGTHRGRRDLSLSDTVVEKGTMLSTPEKGVLCILQPHGCTSADSARPRPVVRRAGRCHAARHPGPGHGRRCVRQRAGRALRDVVRRRAEARGRARTSPAGHQTERRPRAARGWQP